MQEQGEVESAVLLEVEIKQQMMLVIEYGLLCLVLDKFRSLEAMYLRQLLLFQTISHLLFGQLEFL